MFNARTGTEEASYSCHTSFVSQIECNKKGDLLLTSNSWRTPLSALWSLGTFFDMKLALENEDYVEFSKLQDKIVGTQNEMATVSPKFKKKRLLDVFFFYFEIHKSNFEPTDF